MLMNKRISVIIPVCNVAAWLEQCITSVLRQGLEESEYEIILVDFGSTDNSLEICRQYEQKARCVRVVPEGKTSLADARNKGVLAAQGDYICFVDADDTLASGSLRRLIPYADGRYDLVRYWSKLVYGKEKPLDAFEDGNVLFTEGGLAYMRRFGLETFCWCWLYKRSFLLENDLKFYPGIYGEDFRFITDVLLKDPLVLSTSIRSYNYIIRKGSLSTKRSCMNSRIWTDSILDNFKHFSGISETFRTTDPVLSDRFMRSLGDRVPNLFAHMLKARLPEDEFKKNVEICRDFMTLPPDPSRPEGKKMSLALSACRFLSAHPAMYPLTSFFYRLVFVSCFKPHMNRNK